MSISATDILQAFQQLSPEQRQELLDLTRPRINPIPGPRTDLRRIPSDKYPAPHFSHETAWRDDLAHGSEYPRLMWHTQTGREVTAHDAKEEAAFGKLYVRTAPGSVAVDPTAHLQEIFAGLSDEDKAFVKQFEDQQRRAELLKVMGHLTPDQIASATTPPRKAKSA